MKATYVYFIRPVGLHGPTKIGCSNSPERRVVELAQWSPLPLEIVATIPGDGSLECAFHTLFREHHSHHEWFRESPDICAAIDAIQRGWFDVRSLPKGRKLPTRADAPRWPEHKRIIHSLKRRLDFAEERSGARLPQEVRAAITRVHGSVFTNWPCEAERSGDREICEAFIHLWPRAKRRAAA